MAISNLHIEFINIDNLLHKHATELYKKKNLEQNSKTACEGTLVTLLDRQNK